MFVAGKNHTNVSLFVQRVTYVAYFLFSSSIASGIRMGVVRDKSSITILVSRVHISMSCACAYALVHIIMLVHNIARVLVTLHGMYLCVFMLLCVCILRSELSEHNCSTH